MSEDGAELVESGAFRLDRARALEKIKRYQLPDPTRGVFFWVRAAVAAGAKTLEVRHGKGFLELRHDGRPFTKGELADPYGGLFYGDARRRQFALGLLWLVRMRPAAVAVSSGGWSLKVESLERDSVLESPGGSGHTVLKARWGGVLRMFKEAPWQRAAAEYGLRCAMSGIEIKVSGREITEDPFAQRKVVHEFVRKGARVRMSHWNAPGSRTAVDLSVLGVRADSVAQPPRFLPCWVLADSPELELDASQFRAVKNASLEALLERIAREEKKLLEQLLTAFEAGAAEDGLVDSLREACWLLLKSPRTDGRDPLLRRLWRAPLAVDDRGRVRGLAEALQEPRAGWFAAERDRRKFAALQKRAGGVP
jgi:hypothetical protein